MEPTLQEYGGGNETILYLLGEKRCDEYKFNKASLKKFLHIPKTKG